HVFPDDHRRRCRPGKTHLHPVSTECRMTEMNNGAVVLDHVSKAFGDKQVLRDITLSVERNEALCIVGRSGTGKSVTLKLIIALLKPDVGRVWVDGDDITRLEGVDLSRVRRKMGF